MSHHVVLIQKNVLSSTAPFYSDTFCEVGSLWAISLYAHKYPLCLSSTLVGE